GWRGASARSSRARWRRRRACESPPRRRATRAPLPAPARSRCRRRCREARPGRHRSRPWRAWPRRATARGPSLRSSGGAGARTGSTAHERILRDVSGPHRGSSPAQDAGVEPQVIFDESRDEVVAVIVPLVAPEPELETVLAAGGFERLRVQLLGEELVGEALVHQDRVPRLRHLPRLHQLRGIVLPPAVPVPAEIMRERLLPPRAVDRVADRRVLRDAEVVLRAPPAARASAAASPRMPENALACAVAAKLGEQDPRQLLRDV